MSLFHHSGSPYIEQGWSDSSIHQPTNVRNRVTQMRGQATLLIFEKEHNNCLKFLSKDSQLQTGYSLSSQYLNIVVSHWEIN